ncbi:MAG: hypothetical protein QM256_05715 [Pseudomonadota bacterium]|jgi:hypothetical protein|nr:hypothetical protein [Pseudomonadota bacterium]NLX31760.1 hypothetical protein [Deltaproteobacteria bacterium]HNU84398.1 hypothetical protein [Syntrophales bacterium]HNZ35786.1 hypothetical protein [Syntrophales bacterium]HOF73428.1 hypothetical protein [Syntrophales bacterium]
MNELSKDELKLLIEKGRTPSLSIYMPTHRAGAEVQQNAIRLKNLLKEAEEGLLRGGRRAIEAEKFLEPVQALVKNSPFWRQQSNGLALFLCPDFFRTYRLPVEFLPSVVLAERFNVKPLLPLFNTEGRFYVLALSQKDVRLLVCSRYGVKETRPEGLPRDIDEALKVDPAGKRLRSRSSSSGGTGPRGSTAWTDEMYTKENVLRYLQQIDKSLRAILKDERDPLIFAGVEYVFSLYREVNTYAGLAETAIIGNPDQASAEELHALALPVVEPRFRREQEEARVRYLQSIGTGLASNNLEEIVPAAHHGRIGYLFVEVGREKWGTFDSRTGKAVLHNGGREGDEDLIDFAAIHTLGAGGKVYAIERDRMPDREPVAALFRY